MNSRSQPQSDPDKLSVAADSVKGDEAVPTVGADDFMAATGEKLSDALDLETWQPGEKLAELYERLELEVEEAVRQENRIRNEIRDKVFPLLRSRPEAPQNAGVYRTTTEQIEGVHRDILFNGGVEACDGTSAIHDTLPITIVQIGVCKVSYQGDQGAWTHRLYRRDLRAGGENPIEEALGVLDKRRERSGYDQFSRRDTLTNLLRRGIMAYAERAVLSKKAVAPWRMGHGNPMPYEMLTGSGSPELLATSIELLDELVLRHKKFVFVPSAPASRMLITIGNALMPLEYALIEDNQEALRKIRAGHYRGEWKKLLPDLDKFMEEAGRKVLTGMFRVSRHSPPQMFFAHSDHSHEAALIALADASLQEHRGFPMLIDMADSICSMMFGAEVFKASTQLAYTRAGEPFRYMPERQTRF